MPLAIISPGTKILVSLEQPFGFSISYHQILLYSSLFALYYPLNVSKIYPVCQYGNSIKIIAKVTMAGASRATARPGFSRNVFWVIRADIVRSKRVISALISTAFTVCISVNLGKSSPSAGLISYS